MTAFLGMYDMPALKGANDRFWALIRAHLGCGPDHLARDVDPWTIWRSPDLVLAQTCGLPFRSQLHCHVRLVGTPDYGLPECPPGFYRSVLVVRDDAPYVRLEDVAGGTLAYNEALSQSGWAAPVDHLGKAGIPISNLVQTGSHAGSAISVAEGRADLAGLDALTWALLCEHEPGLANRLRILDQTDPTPGLPYITAPGRNPTAIARAVDTAIGELSQGDRNLLHIRGLVRIPPETYLEIPVPAGP